MTAWITLAKLVVLCLFIITAAGMTAYDIVYVWPAKRCERVGAWWDPRDRQCLTPIPIWLLTHRGPLAGPSLSPAAPPQRVAPGAQSTSPAPLALAKRAATNSRSDNRLR
jgi:hypothetical protein